MVNIHFIQIDLEKSILTEEWLHNKSHYRRCCTYKKFLDEQPNAFNGFDLLTLYWRFTDNAFRNE
jgi:hypothetical protein